MEQLFCPWEQSVYLFFSSNVPNLVHYSHAVAILAVFSIGVFIFLNNPKSVVNRLFLFFVSIFSLWVILDVILWATNRPDVVMFAWSLQILLEPLSYVVAFYLYYLFLRKSWPSLKVNLLITLLLLPVIILLPTEYSLQSIYIPDCEAFEGLVGMYYTHFLHAGMMLSIALMAVRYIPTLSVRHERMIALCFGFGLITFLMAFSSGTIIGSLTDDWTLSQYGLFGAPIFAGFIAYSVVQFNAFNVKVLSAQMLIAALAVAVISLVTLQQLENVRIVASFTFILVCVLGYVLVRSVKREVEQREHIQILADNLKLANEKLKELDKLKSQFLSIATHELRTPLTIVRNFVSLMIDGSYGKVPPAAEEAGRQVFERVNDMARSVDTYLNVSRIEQGKISYSFAEADLTHLTTLAVEGLRANATKRGLTLSIAIKPGAEKLKGKYDAPKIAEVLINLIDNSIKYTEKGSISVLVEKVGSRGVVTIRDTGVGMTEKTQKNLFKLFSPGEDSKRINPASTGVGLYVSLAHVVAHKGTLTAASDGPGKGSRFTVELPLA